MTEDLPITDEVEARRQARINATVRIEAVKIEGSLRAIRDLAGFGAAYGVAHDALRRVKRSGPTADGWCA